MEFKEYLAIIRRRWLLFFPIFALIVGAHLFWMNYGHKSHFTATSKVIISENRDFAPNAGSILPIGLPDVSSSTKEATITDYPVLRRAAELALGAVEFQSTEFDSPRIRSQVSQGVASLAMQYSNTEDGIERLVQVLQESVGVNRQSDRQIVEITVEGGQELETLVLSWAVAEAAHQFHDEKARSGIDEFLASADVMIEEIQEEVRQAHDELRASQQEVGITNFGEKERQILQNLYRIERDEDRATTDARKNDRLIQHRLQEQSFQGRVDIQSDVALESQGRVGEIRGMLFQKKLDLDAKLSALSPRHPEVHALRGTISSLERSMAKAQDSVLAEKYKQFSHETNGLIKNNAMIQLELEVMAESKNRLNDELYALTSMRQDFLPKETRYQEAQERLGTLAAAHKQMSWLAEGPLGTVSVYDPAIMVDRVTIGGSGFGPLSLTLLMAFIFSLGVVYIVEYVDTRMKSEHDVRRHLNLPLLGIIPRETGSRGLLTEAPPQSEISEKFNTAATLIQSTGRDLDLRSLMVCSAIAREGKTTVSINLSVALARKGARVCLVDGDLRISQIHKVLRLPNHTGLSTVLDARVDPSRIIEGVMTEEDYAGGPVSAMQHVQRTQIDGLDVLTSGPSTADPVTLLDSGRLARLVAELKQHYDFVIFDTPPINKVGDALTISACLDGCVFVVGSGQAEQHDVTWAKHLLANVQANILGVFLNKFAKQRGSEYYYYYYENDRKRKRVKSRA